MRSGLAPAIRKTVNVLMGRTCGVDALSMCRRVWETAYTTSHGPTRSGLTPAMRKTVPFVMTRPGSSFLRPPSSLRLLGAELRRLAHKSNSLKQATELGSRMVRTTNNVKKCWRRMFRVMPTSRCPESPADQDPLRGRRRGRADEMENDDEEQEEASETKSRSHGSGRLG